MESQRVKGEGDDHHVLTTDYDLPEWLLLEILPRLPIKTIFMFKCVSKRWNSFISDPFFASSYVSRRINISSYLMPWTILTGYGWSKFYRNYSDQTKLVRLCYDDYKSPTVSVLDFPLSEQKQEHKYFLEICKILASSNGLLLCYADYTSIYYVCNPLTRQWVVLPAPDYACGSNYVAFVTQVEGAVVASYKVIRLLPLPRNDYPTNCLTMEIFHSETGVWKPQKVNCPRNVLVCWYKIPTTFNGIVHWFLQCSTSNHILAYDPDKNIDQCRLIELPILLSYNDRDLCRVSQGYLHYVHTVMSGGLQMWVLEDYDSGKWEFKYNITWGGISTKVLGFHPFDSGIVYVRREKQILSYNTRIKSWELIYDLDSGDIACYSSVVLPFVLPLWPPSVPHTSLGVRLLCSG